MFQQHAVHSSEASLRRGFIKEQIEFASKNGRIDSPCISDWKRIIMAALIGRFSPDLRSSTPLFGNSTPDTAIPMNYRLPSAVRCAQVAPSIVPP
jgi:hypothetical protein